MKILSAANSDEKLGNSMRKLRARKLGEKQDKKLTKCFNFSPLQREMMLDFFFNIVFFYYY